MLKIKSYISLCFSCLICLACVGIAADKSIDKNTNTSPSNSNTNTKIETPVAEKTLPATTKNINSADEKQLPAKLKSSNEQISPAANKNVSSNYLLDTLRAKYAKSPYIKMDVEKKIVLGILKKERLSSGLLMIGNNGKLRFEILKPQTNLSILDGKNAWLIENPDEKELPVRVIKSSGDNYKKSQSILMLAFGKGDIDEFFDLDSKSLENNIGSYVFTSKEKSFEVKKLQIFIDTKALVIQAIHYWDNLNNKTELSFKNTEFLNKMSENNFKYTAPKNAEITILK